MWLPAKLTTLIVGVQGLGDPRFDALSEALAVLKNEATEHRAFVRLNSLQGRLYGTSIDLPLAKVTVDVQFARGDLGIFKIMSGLSIQRLERLCEVLYTSGNQNERKEAEVHANCSKAQPNNVLTQAQLLILQSSTQYIPDLLQIFDQSTSSYALLIAGTSLSWVVLTNWNKIRAEERLEIRMFVMNYLVARGPGLTDFVTTCLVKLVVRITKLGWFDGTRHREIVDEALKLYKTSADHCSLALQLLCALVEEFNTTSGRGDTRSLTQHRKCAVSFRDASLFSTVQVAQSTLSRLQTREGLGALSRAQEDRIAEFALKLLTTCLNFDFIGTNADESSDDVGTIQLPSNWRPIAHDPILVAGLFEFFQRSNPPRSSSAMQCLILLSSVRRSLFVNEAERARFLNQMMRGIRDVLASRSGLQHEENYHEFCRLLGRLKSNYQLSELVNADVYAEWLELAAAFTTTSFDQWQWSRNSIHYLLTLWGRLVAAVPYAHRAQTATSNGSISGSPGGDTSSAAQQQDHARLLEQCVLKVARKYIESMLMSVHLVDASEGSIDDPLDDEGALKEQLERLPVLCRFRYQEIAQFVLEGFDTTTARYRDVLGRGAQSPTRNPQMGVGRSAIERQLAWLAYVIAAIIGGISWNQLPLSEGEETLDANLSRRIFDLSQLVDYAHRHSNAAAPVPGGSHRCDERLELALLYFLTNFRRVYLWEQHSIPAQRAELGTPTAKQRVFMRVFEQMGLGDSSALMNCIVMKIANNLRHWPSHEEIVRQTLALFQEMTSGLAPGKLMLNLDATQFLLEHRTADHLPFMIQARPRHRTTLHATLGRLVFCVVDDVQAAFDAFIAPLHATLRSLSEASSNGIGAASANPDFITCLIGALRDLRGVTQAAHNRRAYNMLFDALYPVHFELFTRAAESDNPEVMVSILRFMHEFVTNKGQRITFERSSPNGILLFREASRVVVAYGTRELTRRAHHANNAPNAHGVSSPNGALSDAHAAERARNGGSTDEYRTRHKGVVIALGVLTRALDGNYVNLGVFSLYNDRALSDALEIAMRLTFACPIDDILAYPKLAQAYFAFYEVLFREHISFVICKDTDTFSLLLSAIHDALEVQNLAIVAATTLDHLATYRFTHQSKHNLPAMQALNAHLASRPNLLKKLLTTLFNQLLFGPPTAPGSSANHWVLTRPILSLMLIDERAFLEYKDDLVASQTTHELRQRLIDAFASLVANVHRNLEPSNRDHFTQAISTFRHEVRQFLVC